MSGLRVGFAELRLTSRRRLRDGSSSQSSSSSSSPWICPSCYAGLRVGSRKRGVHGVGQTTAALMSSGSDMLSSPDDSASNTSTLRRPPPRSNPSKAATSLLSATERRPTNSNRTVEEYLSDLERRSTSVKPTIPANKANLKEALKTKNTQLLYGILEKASEDPKLELLRSIPGATWTEIIRAFDPANYSSPYHRMHGSLNPNAMRNIGFPYARQQDRFATLIPNLITTIQRTGSTSLSFADYRTLLRFAAARGQPGVAWDLWRSLKSQGFQPDVVCYNRLMESILYAEDNRLQQKRLAKGWFRDLDMPKHTPITIFNTEGLQQINELFSEMTRQGIKGDSRTICLVLTALGRLGELEGVASLLMQAWDLDVHSIEAGEQDPQSAVAISPTSPMYPGAQVLNTIAEVYGMNDKVPLALHLVDLTSRKYNIRVEKNVWYKLLHWMWMYARIARDENPLDSNKRLEDVRTIIKMMFDQQNSPKPSLEICHVLFKTVYEQDPWNQDAVSPPMIAGRLLYAEAAKKYRRAAQDLKQAQTSHAPTPVLRKSRASLLNDVRNLRIAVRQHATYLRRWAASCARRRISWTWNPEPETLVQAEEWWYRGLPNFLVSWEDWVPATLKYSTRSGMIELKLQSSQPDVFQRDYDGITHREQHWMGEMQRKAEESFPESGQFQGKDQQRQQKVSPWHITGLDAI